LGLLTLVIKKGEKKMTNSFYWTSFDSIWNRFDTALSNWNGLVWDSVNSQPRQKLANMPSYPHSDVWFDQDGKFLWIRFALAGYAKDAIKVRAVGNQLRISAKGEKEPEIKFVHHGISSKDVDFVLAVDEGFDPTKAETAYENGMLTLKVPRAKGMQEIDLM